MIYLANHEDIKSISVVVTSKDDLKVSCDILGIMNDESKDHEILLSQVNPAEAILYAANICKNYDFELDIDERVYRTDEEVDSTLGLIEMALKKGGCDLLVLDSYVDENKEMKYKWIDLNTFKYIDPKLSTAEFKGPIVVSGGYIPDHRHFDTISLANKNINVTVTYTDKLYTYGNFDIEASREINKDGLMTYTNSFHSDLFSDKMEEMNRNRSIRVSGDILDDMDKYIGVYGDISLDPLKIDPSDIPTPLKKNHLQINQIPGTAETIDHRRNRRMEASRIRAAKKKAGKVRYR